MRENNDKTIILIVGVVLVLSGCESGSIDTDLMSETSTSESFLLEQQMEEDKGIDVLAEELDQEVADLDVETDFAVLDTAEFQ